MSGEPLEENVKRSLSLVQKLLTVLVKVACDLFPRQRLQNMFRHTVKVGKQYLSSALSVLKEGHNIMHTCSGTRKGRLSKQSVPREWCD